MTDIKSPEDRSRNIAAIRSKDASTHICRKSNVEFWNKKFLQNKLRDQKVKYDLQNEGIKELVVWECTIARMIRDEYFKSVVIDECVRFMRTTEQYDEF